MPKLSSRGTCLLELEPPGTALFPPFLVDALARNPFYMAASSHPSSKVLVEGFQGGFRTTPLAPPVDCTSSHLGARACTFSIMWEALCQSLLSLTPNAEAGRRFAQQHFQPTSHQSELGAVEPPT